MASKKVSIEVGHGGRDPGAVANGFMEKNIALSVSLELQRELTRHGVDVLISRVSDVDDRAAHFVPKIKAYKPDVGVSIHFNAGGGDGAEFYANVGASGKLAAVSEGLCRCIEKEVLALGQNSRGVKPKPADFLGIMDCVPAYAYLEGGFIDNLKDLAAFDTPQKQKAFGAAYAKGILAYFGIAYKTEAVFATVPATVPATIPTPATAEVKQDADGEGKTLYHVQVGAFASRENAQAFLKEHVNGRGLDGVIKQEKHLGEQFDDTGMATALEVARRA